MCGIELLVRQSRSAQAVLIRDHDECEARVFQSEQGRHHAGNEANFLEIVYLFVRRFLVQSTVAIHKYDTSAVHADPRLLSNASFCARVPTEMRKECGSAGLARKSRT